jgi:hypothetical protein
LIRFARGNFLEVDWIFPVGNVDDASRHFRSRTSDIRGRNIKQADIFGDHCNEQLKNESLCTLSIFTAKHNLFEHGRHLVRSAASDLDPVVAEDWFLPKRQQKIECTDAVRQLSEFDFLYWIEQLCVEIVNPELIEVAQNDIRRALRNNVRPLIESLVVMFLQILAARFHLYEHAIWPKKIGKFLSAFRSSGSAVSFDQFELRRAGLFRNAKFERRACFNCAIVPKRSEETIDETLPLAFLIAF